MIGQQVEEGAGMRSRAYWSAVAIGQLALGLVLAPTSAAQTIGDAAKGKAYASSVCAECHNIEPGGTSSRLPAATPFQIVATTPGMTSTALTVFFRTPHKNMPNLIVKDQDADNVIAYILSLKQD